MGNRHISGSSFSMNHEVNFIGRKTVTRSKGKSWPMLNNNDIKEPVNIGSYIAVVLGAIPVCSGSSQISPQVMAVLGALATAGTIHVKQDQKTGQFTAGYAPSLQKVMNGAYAKNGSLGEEQLRLLIMLYVSQMLQQAGPGMVSWRQVLIEAMQSATLEDFMKGVQSVVCAITGDPINANTGNFLYNKEDLSVGGRHPLKFCRFYNRIDTRIGCMGKGWRHNYEIELLIQKDRYVIIWEDGREEIYLREQGQAPEALFGCLTRLEETEGGFRYENKEGIVYLFNQEGHLLNALDKNGQGLLFLYDKNGRLSQVSNGAGASLSYRYEQINGRLIQVADHTGRSVVLYYELGHLARVTNPLGQTYAYYYDKDRSIYKIKNPRNVVTLKNEYDDRGRTISQTFADGGLLQYDYQDEQSRTLMTEQNGNRIVYVHDEKYHNVKTLYYDGEETFEYNSRNQRTLYIDKNGNKTRFSYDEKGNITQILYPDGSKHSMTYDANNRLLVLSINGRVKIKNAYDGKGNLLLREDGLGRVRTFHYNESGNVIKMEQPDKSVIQLVYDNRGNVTELTEAGGNTVFYTYDELNRVIQTIDGNGNKIRYAYDTNNQIVQVVNAEGSKRSYEYTANGYVSKVIDFNGAVTTQIYNKMNKVKEVIMPDGARQHFEYDLMQNLSKRINPCGAEYLYEYDPLKRLEKILLPTGGQITYEYDPNGNRTSITDANGNKTKIEYDEMNRITAVTEADGAVTEYEYDMEGNLISIINAVGKSHTYIYDAAGQKISETDILGNTVSFGYNEMGKVTSITTPRNQMIHYEYSAGGLLSKTIYPDNSWEVYQYDQNNNLIRRENQKGNYIVYTYDYLDRMIHMRNNQGQKCDYTYDAVGNITSLSDALGNTTEYEYSPGGNLRAVTDAVGNKTEYGYDAAGRLTAVFRHEGRGSYMNLNGEIHAAGSILPKTPLRLTRYERNETGKIIKVIDSLGNEETYDYDLGGQLIGKTDKEGYYTDYHYTPANKFSAIIYHDGRSVEYSYNTLRQLIEVRDWLGTTTIEPDAAGRTNRIIDYKGREIRYQWNRWGDREATLYPDGKKVTYQYNEMGQLSHMEDSITVIDYEYHEDGRLVAKYYANDLRTLYSYNEAGYLECLTHQYESDILEQNHYQYDLVGNKTKIKKERNHQFDVLSLPKEIRDKLRENNGTYEYQYDALYRLTNVRRNEKTLHRYEYDAFGNRTKKYDGETGSWESYSYNEMDQLLKNGKESYHYDRRGNLTGIMKEGQLVTGYQYDETNRLRKAANGKGQMACYQYNGLGNRIGYQEYSHEIDLWTGIKSLEAVNWNIEADVNPMKEVDYLLDLTKPYHNLLTKTELAGEIEHCQDYIWESNVVAMTEGESACIYLQDELGSPVRLLDMHGTCQMVYGYDEFGQDLFGNQGEVQPFGYTGYQMDKVANTYFAQAREYLPGFGRFGGEDMVKGSLAEPMTLNPYGYCISDPINWLDPDGKKRRKNYGPSVDDITNQFWSDMYKSADKAWKSTLNAIFNRTDDIFDVTIEFGTGLGVKGTINSIKVGGVAKSYIEVDKHFVADFKMEAGITTGYEDLFEAGISGQYSDATKDSKVLVGVESFEWDGTLKSKFGGEVYAGIGGGAYVTVDWIKVGETIYDFGKALLGCGSQK